MKNILIVIDMQKDFVDGALGSAEATKIVRRVAEKIRSFEGEIIVTLDTHGTDYMETSEGKFLPVPHCVKGTDGWELDRGVEAALEGKYYTILEKPTFGSVELPTTVASLTNGEAFSAEFIGVCTDICVISNVLLLKAHYPEAELSVDASCCAGVTPATHTAALQTMQSCQIVIKNNG